MSYLDTLRQKRAEQDTFGRLLSTIGTGAAEAMTQSRAQAQERAKVLQQMGESARTSGDWETAARLIPEFQAAMQTGYDIKPMVAPQVGTPITRQQLGPVPLGAPPLPSVEIGRSFEAPETKKKIRAGLMLQPLKPVEVSGALYDPESGTWSVSPAAMTPQARMELQQERLRSQAELARERQRSAESRAAEQRALSMAIAGMRIGAQRDMFGQRQQAAIGKRASDAFENLMGQIPTPVAADVITLPSGKQGFALKMPLAVNEQDVIRRASQQGFIPTRDAAGNFILEPTSLVQPRARAPQRQQLTPVAAEGGGLEWGVKKPGVKIPAKTLTPTDEAKIAKEVRQQLMQETPGAVNEIVLGTMLQRNPELRARQAQLLSERFAPYVRGQAGQAAQPALTGDPFTDIQIQMQAEQAQRRQGR